MSEIQNNIDLILSLDQKNFELNISREKDNGSIKIRPGSIVACDLAYGMMDHTGVYIGNGQIVELNGDGKVRKVSIKDFLHNGGLRTGDTIFTPTWNNQLLFSPIWGIEAKKNIGLNTDYNLSVNNCHNFVYLCMQPKETPANEKTQYQQYIKSCNRNMDTKTIFQIIMEYYPTAFITNNLINSIQHDGITTFESLSKLLFIHQIMHDKVYIQHISNAVENQLALYNFNDKKEREIFNTYLMKQSLDVAKLLFKWKIAEY